MKSYRAELLICLGLAAITLGCLGHTCANDFVNFDDPMYVTENPHLHDGVSLAGLTWAFTDFDYHMWNPLTRFSFLVDYQIHGLEPAGYHLTNLVLHLANVLLLFGWLRYTTGTAWRSAVVAAFFAVHPLRVESVAWVTERKDVLSAFFGLVALWGYTHYVRRPSWRRYLGMVLAFCLSLLAKPMLVTLPLLLLLLDYWPFRRLGPAGVSWRRLVLEKLPMLALAAAMSLVTLDVQTRIGQTAAQGDLSLTYRLGNAVVAYVVYLKLTFWPAGMAVIYPHPESSLPVGPAIGALALLAILTGIAVFAVRKFPYVLVGWLWFLGSLVPVLGLVSVGHYALADRYTYIPHMGLLVALAWLVRELWARWRRPRTLPVLLSGALLACMVVTALQVRIWRDSQSLWEHALAVTEKNYMAHDLLGNLCEQNGELASARVHYSLACSLRPSEAQYSCNLARVLIRDHRMVEAETVLNAALAANPDDLGLHAQMGDWNRALGRSSEAKEWYLKAIRGGTMQAEAYHGLGLLLAQEGQLQSARECFIEALRLQPDDVDSLDALGLTLFRLGQTCEAMARWREALRYNPAYADAHYHLGLAHAEEGHSDLAQREYAKALRHEPRHAEADFALALLLESDGKLEAAAAAARAAVEAKPAWLEARIQLGLLLVQVGRTAEAAEQFEQCVRSHPDSADAHNGLGLTEVHRRNFPQAATHFARAVARQPGNPTFRFNLALAMVRAGQFQEAHAHLEAVLRLAPDHPGARQTLDEIMPHVSTHGRPPD
jgi:tetratricopeptide (TPR) repeat protein